MRRRPGITGALGLAVVLAACTSGGNSSPSSTRPAGGVTTTIDDALPGTTGSSGPSSTPTVPGGSADVPSEVVDGFDDHTVSRLRSTDDFFALARAGVRGQQIVKFSIPEMPRSDDVRWMDSNFYELHDEWYWFRLLNGRTVPGFDTEPVEGGPEFDTVGDIVEWARRQGELPLDLRFLDSLVRGDRLYSPNFYREGLPDDGRNYGLGAVIFFPEAADGRDHWLLELQFGDAPTPEAVARYFELIDATVPPEIGDALEWVIRSPEQDRIAQAMGAARTPYHDRIVRFSELAPAGETAVYNPGIAAGRLLVIDGVTARLTDARDSDIVIVEHTPGWLPPAAALLTSDPQTPLSHVNLLARNRGIPNASVQGLLDDPGIRQAARIRSHAVVRATPDGGLDLALISQDEYDAWSGLTRPAPIAVPAVDLFSLPVTVDLTELATAVDDDDDVDEWRPIIGGKAAGFLHLLATPDVELPPNPIAITVAPYLRHQMLVRDELDAMMADPEFQRSPTVRYLYLEGRDDFLEAFPDEAPLAQRLFDEHDPSTPLGRILRAGGFQRLWRDAPMDRSDLAAITAAVRTANADLDPNQGIRFRSSSSVEDIEGFNGAGLYDSNTGFLDPVAAGEDADRTFERAIKRTWASYWSFEAFEERHRERISHISGEMAVLVHARFDDDLEANNGVATASVLPDGTTEVTINVQDGPVSVANPDADGDLVLPEVVVVRDGPGGPTIERIAASTLVDGAVLDDEAVIELARAAIATATVWLERTNTPLPEGMESRTLTVDLEFKTVRPGWPALESGELPARLVIKQARSLEPGLRRIPPDVRALPVPRDVLARAGSVRDVCGAIEVLTDPLVFPDMGHADQPLVVTIGTPVDETCTPTTLYSSPDQYLVELLAAGTALELTP